MERRLAHYCAQRGVSYITPSARESPEYKARRVSGLAGHLTFRQQRRLRKKGVDFR